MKRNRYGINFDLGVPLQTEEEFELLYVELNAEDKQRLIDWMKNENRKPAIVAGQIGTGKTTFIEKTRIEASVSFDIQIALDTEIPLYDRGGFWGVFLGKIIEFARQKECDASSFKLPEDLLGIKYTDGGLVKLANALCAKPLSFSDFSEKKQLYNKIDEKFEFIKRQLADIIELIKDKIGRELFVFAEGVDKFNRATAEFKSLLDLLDFLSRYKTLYEANFIHLTAAADRTDQRWHDGTKFFITNETPENIYKIMRKRLGVYSKVKEGVLPILSQLSGGNLRQGLRLLIEYDYASEKESKEAKDTLDNTFRRVRDDLLNVSAGNINLELLKVVQRDKYITSGTLNSPSSMEDAQNAVYLNWILILKDFDKELKWEAIVNPLIIPVVEAYKSNPESPETCMLSEWSVAEEISPYGLDIDTYELDWNKFFDIIGSRRILEPLNIMEIFDRMAAYFLSSERKDKIIIAYDNKELVELANDFFIGRAGTYKPGNFKDIKFDEMPHQRLDIYLSEIEDEKYDGYSVIFEKEITKSVLIELDQRRDVFIDYKMIWWIPYDDLIGYLKYWPQLRQFFKIYHLEEDILSNISIEEIEEDLEDIDSIDFMEHNKEQLKQRLQNVLNYLKEVRNGQ